MKFMLRYDRGGCPLLGQPFPLSNTKSAKNPPSHVLQPTIVLKKIHENFHIFQKPFAFFHRIDFFAEMGLLSLTDVLV